MFHLLVFGRLKTARELGEATTKRPMEENDFLRFIVDSVDDYWQAMNVKPTITKDECMVSTSG